MAGTTRYALTPHQLRSRGSRHTAPQTCLAFGDGAKSNASSHLPGAAMHQLQAEPRFNPIGERQPVIQHGQLKNIFRELELNTYFFRPAMAHGINNGLSLDPEELVLDGFQGMVVFTIKTQLKLRTGRDGEVVGQLRDSARKFNLGMAILIVGKPKVLR